MVLASIAKTTSKLKENKKIVVRPIRQAARRHCFTLYIEVSPPDEGGMFWAWRCELT
jgi:hypothetical protein